MPGAAVNQLVRRSVPTIAPPQQQRCHPAGREGSSRRPRAWLGASRLAAPRRKGCGLPLQYLLRAVAGDAALPSRCFARASRSVLLPPTVRASSWLGSRGERY